MQGPDPGSGADDASPRLSDYLRVFPQYLIPQRTLSALMFRLTRIRARLWKSLQIQWFIRHFQVDMAIATKPDPSAYPDFNSFFTRTLRPDARPLPEDPADIACPADGRLVALGDIDDGHLLQAKGHEFSVLALLGGSEGRAAPFRDGKFATVYLSPRDYHRVHMPIAGRLREMLHIPGRLFSVNASTTRLVPGLFARNERLVTLFDTQLGPMAVILVGAIFVGSIETVWAGRLTPPYGHGVRTWRYPDPAHGHVELERGAEVGRFNMGSTVILLLPGDSATWQATLELGTTVNMGAPMGKALSHDGGAEG